MADANATVKTSMSRDRGNARATPRARRYGDGPQRHQSSPLRRATRRNRVPRNSNVAEVIPSRGQMQTLTSYPKLIPCFDEIAVARRRLSRNVQTRRTMAGPSTSAKPQNRANFVRLGAMDTCQLRPGEGHTVAHDLSDRPPLHLFRHPLLTNYACPGDLDEL